MSNELGSFFEPMQIPRDGLTKVRKRARHRAIVHQVRVTIASVLAVVATVIGLTFASSSPISLAFQSGSSATVGESVEAPTSGSNADTSSSLREESKSPSSLSPNDIAVSPQTEDAHDFLSGLGYTFLFFSIPLLLIAGALAIFVTRRAEMPQRRLPTTSRALLAIALVGPFVSQGLQLLS